MTIHQLLPIPEGTKQPHAYQVFGLEVGESDPEVIKQAVKETVQRLKDSKASTDSKTWALAAKLVQQAKQVLSDPELKSQLDARFGIVDIPTAPAEPAGPVAPPPPAPPSKDPLSAVLPTSDPLAAVLPPSNPLASNAPAQSPTGAPPSAVAEPPTAMPPGVFGTPQQEAPVIATEVASPTGTGPAEAMSSVVVKQPTRQSSRRRTSPLGVLMFFFFAVCMMGLIGVMAFVLLRGGTVAVTQSNDGVAISVGQNAPEAVAPDADQTNDAQPTVAQPRPLDPVMGTMAGDNVPPPGGDNAGSSRPGRSLLDKPEMTETNNQSPSPSMIAEMTGASDNNPPAQPPKVETPAPTPPGEMTDEMVAAADESIQKVEELLRTANWKEMKSAAEKLTESSLNKTQKERAEALYELAELASYYRGGIERGVDSLVVGNDFAVTDSFRVIVVEKGDDKLVIRYNAKNRSYTFDEFPFSLANKLAAFAMPMDAPATEAAKAAYQALAPKATDEHRKEAIDWLNEIDEEVEGADPKRVAKTIASLFSS